MPKNKGFAGEKILQPASTHFDTDRRIGTKVDGSGRHQRKRGQREGLGTVEFSRALEAVGRMERELRKPYISRPQFTHDIASTKGNARMTRFAIILTGVLLLLLSFSGCKKDDASTNADQYTDKLTVGLGLNSANLFQLVGEGSTFTYTSNLMIYWRLESKDDMGGSSVTIKIEKLTSGTYTTVQSIPYPNPQSYGHIMLSSFPVTTTGSYRATGILTTGTKTVATCTFTVQ